MERKVARRQLFFGAALWFTCFLFSGLLVPGDSGWRWWLIGSAPSVPIGLLLAVFASGRPRREKVAAVAILTPLLQAAVSLVIWFVRGVLVREKIDFLLACGVVSLLMGCGWLVGQAALRQGSPEKVPEKAQGIRPSKPGERGGTD